MKLLCKHAQNQIITQVSSFQTPKLCWDWFQKALHLPVELTESCCQICFLNSGLEWTTVCSRAQIESIHIKSQESINWLQAAIGQAVTFSTWQKPPSCCQLHIHEKEAHATKFLLWRDNAVINFVQFSAEPQCSISFTLMRTTKNIWIKVTCQRLISSALELHIFKIFLGSQDAMQDFETNIFIKVGDEFEAHNHVSRVVSVNFRRKQVTAEADELRSKCIIGINEELICNYYS